MTLTAVVVDPGDHVADADMLVVDDGHGRDVAWHLGGDGELEGGDEGIVGRDETPAVVQIQPGSRRGGEQGEGADSGQERKSGDELPALPRASTSTASTGGGSGAGMRWSGATVAELPDDM